MNTETIPPGNPAEKKPMSLPVRVVVAIAALLLGAILFGRIVPVAISESAAMAITIAGGYLSALLAFWATGRRDRASSRRILRWWILLPGCMAAAYALTAWLGLALDRRDGGAMPMINYPPITTWENWNFISGLVLALIGIISILVARRSARGAKNPSRQTPVT